jgi:hypothetical protein
MPTSLREIHQRGVPKGVALNPEAIGEFRHTRDAKSLISPGNKRTSRFFRVSIDGRDAVVCSELKYPAPEYNPSSERLLQLLVDKRVPEPVIKAASLG